MGVPSKKKMSPAEEKSLREGLSRQDAKYKEGLSRIKNDPAYAKQVAENAKRLNEMASDKRANELAAKKQYKPTGVAGLKPSDLLKQGLASKPKLSPQTLQDKFRINLPSEIKGMIGKSTSAPVAKASGLGTAASKMPGLGQRIGQAASASTRPMGIGAAAANAANKMGMGAAAANKMGQMGNAAKQLFAKKPGMKKGGKVTSASKRGDGIATKGNQRADGCAIRGKTRA